MTWKFRWVGSARYAFRRWKISRGFFVFPVPGWELFFWHFELLMGMRKQWRMHHLHALFSHKKYSRCFSILPCRLKETGLVLTCVESGDEGGLHLLWYGQRAWCLSLCFPCPTFRIGWEIHDFLQVEFATSSNAFLRQINSGFYRTGNSKKNSQTITLQMKCNRFILSSIWSITVELSALCPQGMRLSVTKKLKTTGMMWCKMWANHTYRTKVCFQNRKPPCPLRQLSTKNSRSNGKWCIFPGYSLTLGNEEKEVTKSPSLPESSLLLWKWERMQFC